MTSSVAARIVEVPTSRPRTTLVAAVILTTIAVYCVTTLRPETSLDAMIDERNPAALALAQIARDFRPVDELLLVATGEPDAPNVDCLVAFAERFERASAADPALSALVKGVRYRMTHDSPERRFFEEWVVPSGLLYLDVDDLAALERRLTLSGIEEQLRRNEELFAAPGAAADALARTMLRDPLRLNEFLRRPLAELGTGTMPAEEVPAFISTDRQSILIRITAKRPATDLEYTAALVEAAESLAAQVNTDELHVEFTGPHAIAESSRRSIRADMIRSVVGALVLMQVLYLLAYRHLLSFPLAIAPTAIGILVAFAIFAVLDRALSPPTAVIGAILAGLGVDYSIHLMSHWRHSTFDVHEKPSFAPAATAMAAPLTLAMVTSFIGLLAIGQSSVRALRDFSLLAAIGLPLALAASLIVLPALLTLAPAFTPVARVPARFSRIVDQVSDRPQPVVVSVVTIWIVAVAIVLLGSRPILPVDSDLHAMHPQPNPALALNDSISRRFHNATNTWPILITAESADELSHRAFQLETALQGTVARDAGVRGIYGLSSLIPHPDSQARVSSASLPNADAVIRRFRTATEQSIFIPDAFSEYEKFLRTLLTPGEAPDLRTLLEYRELAAGILPIDAVERGIPPTATLVTLLLNDLPDTVQDRAARIEAIRAVIHHVPGATLTGMSIIGHDTQTAIRRDMRQQLLIATIAVIVLLVIVLRNLLDVAITLLPTAFGICCVLAVFHVTNDGLNMINLIGFPLLAGIGVDDGIFIVWLIRSLRRTNEPTARVRVRLAASLHAITVTSATTGLAFGSLMFTSTPAIRSLGAMTAVGVTACWLATICLLAPIALKRIQRFEEGAQ